MSHAGIHDFSFGDSGIPNSNLLQDFYIKKICCISCRKKCIQMTLSSNLVARKDFSFGTNRTTFNIELICALSILVLDYCTSSFLFKYRVRSFGNKQGCHLKINLEKILVQPWFLLEKEILILCCAESILQAIFSWSLWKVETPKDCILFKDSSCHRLMLSLYCHF